MPPSELTGLYETWAKRGARIESPDDRLVKGAVLAYESVGADVMCDLFHDAVERIRRLEIRAETDRAERAEREARIAEVLALHSEEEANGYRFCAYCTDDNGLELASPCPTRRALTGGEPAGSGER